jgi:hypothetical protein
VIEEEDRHQQMNLFVQDLKKAALALKRAA